MMQETRKKRIRSVEHFGMQRKIVAQMTTEGWGAPHCSFMYEPDITEFLAEWRRLKDQPAWQGITINTVLLYLCTMGLAAAPDMNAHIEYHHGTATGTITRFKHVDISMPTTMSDGKMMTLNVQNCESKTLKEINDYVLDLRRRMEKTNLDEAMFEVSMENTLNLAKKLKFHRIGMRLAGLIPSRKEINRLKGEEKKKYLKLTENERLTKKDIKQGTIVISNLGSVYRGAYAPPALIDLVPPMVCALGLGSFVDKPGVVTKADSGTSIEPRKYWPVCIVMDHRALDFDGVAPFCKCLDEAFANPSAMRDWLNRLPAQAAASEKELDVK